MATRAPRKTRPRFAVIAPVARGVGLLLHVPAIMALASLPICWWFAEWQGLRVLIITLLVSLAAGQALFWAAHGQKPTLRRHAMLIAAIAWLGVSGLAALPFVLGQSIAPLDGMFESLSGFTGTGMSVLSVNNVPYYLEWWRSLSQWIGGVGVIVLLLSILPPSQGALELYYSESRDQKLLPNVRATARAIWSIYLVYTLLAVGLLWLGGVPVWRAINHGMTAIATGGFAITDHSLKDATSTVKMLYLPIMIAGAISFYAHYRAAAQRQPRRALLANSEQKLFWTVLILGALALALDNHFLYQTRWLDSVLQWTSALTTTGFQSVDLAQRHAGTLFFMALVMLIGGTAGSTSGGLKVMRVVLLYKTIAWALADVTRRPHEILRLTFDGQALTRADATSRVRATTTLTYAWLLTSAMGVLVFAHCVPQGTPLQYTLFDVFSAQSNVGLTAGLVGPGLSTAGKITLMVIMWMGRLEILPVMVLFAIAVQGAVRGRQV